MSATKNKAFTLTELLVVVIVLGVLAAVAAPKFTRVLETRRTTEAEDLLSAVRTEQEHRCLAGKNYTARPSLLPMTAKADSKYYGLSLEDKGAVAARGDNKNYELRILYNSGKLCCSGEGCAALNKDYEPCDANWGNLSDECAATDGGEPVPPPADPCVTNPNDCECSTYASAHQCECAPSTSTCCEEGETWNEQTQECDKVCLEKYGEPIATASTTQDTCPGNNKTAQYTCDGVFRGTCTDVYRTSLAGGGLASYASDPFWNFDGALAQSTTGGQCPTYMISCPKLVPTHKQWCCPQGTRCKSIGLGEYDCEKGEPGMQPEELCAEGYHKDPNGDCVKDLDLPEATACEAGYVWDEATQTCVRQKLEICEEGCSWNVLQGKCVCSTLPKFTYSRRSVTCCGTGETEIKPKPEPELPEINPDYCLEHPNTEACCKAPSVWNGQFCVMVFDPCKTNPSSCACADYAQDNACECNPSASACCTQAQIKGGMVFNSSTRSCACPSGKTWDGATQSCKSKQKYTCWKNVTGKTRGSCQNHWRVTYYDTGMTCGNESQHHSGTVSCRPGQQCECTPGQQYLWYETYACYATPANSHLEENTGAAVWYCLTCQEVDDLSECPSLSFPKPGNVDFGGSDGPVDMKPFEPFNPALQ